MTQKSKVRQACSGLESDEKERHLVICVTHVTKEGRGSFVTNKCILIAKKPQYNYILVFLINRYTVYTALLDQAGKRFMPLSDYDPGAVWHTQA